MPPKNAAGAVGGASDLTASDQEFLFSVLKNTESIKVDFKAVADENGISYARNA
jgi:hypothetical protein